MKKFIGILTLLLVGLLATPLVYPSTVVLAWSFRDTYKLPSACVEAPAIIGGNCDWYIANLISYPTYYDVYTPSINTWEPAGLLRVYDISANTYYSAYCINYGPFLEGNSNFSNTGYLNNTGQPWGIQMEESYILNHYSNPSGAVGQAAAQTALWFMYNNFTFTKDTGGGSIITQSLSIINAAKTAYTNGYNTIPSTPYGEIISNGSQTLILVGKTGGPSPTPTARPTPTPTPLPTPSPPPNPSLPAFPTFTRGVVMSNPPSVFYAFVPVCSWIEQGNVPAGSQPLPFNPYPVITSQNLDEYQFVYNLSFQAYSSANGTAGDLTWSFDNGQSGIIGPGTPTVALPISPAIPSNVPVPNSCINYHVYKVVTPPNSQGVVNSASTQILWSGTLTRCYIGTGNVCIGPTSTVWSQPLTPDGPVINMAEAPVPVEQIESVPYS